MTFFENLSFINSLLTDLRPATGDLVSGLRKGDISPKPEAA
jgi:hypothetical protein